MDGVHHKHRNISSAYLYETDARLYIKQKSQSSVLVKQAKKNSFKMLSSVCSPDLFCACAIFRIKHAVKNISLLASAVRLFSSAVFFFNVVSMFLMLCNILRSVNSRKALKFLSKRLAMLFDRNQF